MRLIGGKMTVTNENPVSSEYIMLPLSDRPILNDKFNRSIIIVFTYNRLVDGIK